MGVSPEKTYNLAQGMTKLVHCFKPKQFMKDIKPIQMMVIMSIKFMSNDNKNVTPTLICEELGLSKSALTATLNSLEEKGLVTRQLSPNDRRMLLLFLTETAMKLMNSFHDNVQISANNLANYLGDEDTDKFIELLAKSNEFLRKK